MPHPPPDYVLPSTEEESRRLGIQAPLYGGVEVLERLLPGGPAQVLDAGCGAGHNAALLAERLPGASVTGLELDHTRVTQARAWHTAPNLAFTRGNIHSMPFPDGTFDLSATRFVLIHDRDPARAVGEMVRVTRPGGMVAAHDMVHDGIWFSPERPALTRLLGAVTDTMRHIGAEPNQGVHLAGALTAGGLLNVGARAISHLIRKGDAQ